MCFDPATGAMTYVKRHLEGATDVFAATHVTGQVTDDDFSLSQDPAYNSRYDTKSGG